VFTALTPVVLPESIGLLSVSECDKLSHSLATSIKEKSAHSAAKFLCVKTSSGKVVATPIVKNKTNITTYTVPLSNGP